MNLLNLYLNNNEYTYRILRAFCEEWKKPSGNSFRNLYNNDVKEFGKHVAIALQVQIITKEGTTIVDHETEATIEALQAEVIYEIENYEE